jgi:hypothetical protein
MSVRRLFAVLALAAAATATARLQAQQKSAVNARVHTVMTAQTYLEGGMTLHLPRTVALAPDVWRIENGWETGHDAQSLRDAIPRVPEQWSIRIIKWVVQGNEAAAFSDIFTGGGHVATGHYFKLAGDSLKEILIAFTSQGRVGNSPAGIVRAAQRPAGNPLVDIADDFLKGIEKGDLANVKLGPDVLITENNEVKAQPKDAALKHWEQNWLGKITKVTVYRWVVEGPDVVAFYQADRREGRPLWVSQYFRIYDGLIRETWATFGGSATDAEKNAARNVDNR